jgi:hypothetical protein
MKRIHAIAAAGLIVLTGTAAPGQGGEARDPRLEGQTQRHRAAREQAVELRLVGFTAKRSPGTVGLFQLHALCNGEFGVKSRMCTLSEVQRTVSIPDLSMDTAWVNTESYAPADAAGRFSDCGGWSDSGGVGAVVDDLGRFYRTSSCSESHAVACCAPGR